MNDDIIRMAREAGFAHSWSEAAGEALKRFAALAAAAERERIAAFVEDTFDFCGEEILVADAIRARGEE